MTGLVPVLSELWSRARHTLPTCGGLVFFVRFRTIPQGERATTRGEVCVICFGNDEKVTTNKTDLPQWLNDAAKSNVSSASNLQNQGFTSYNNPTVASFSPQQTASFGLGTDVANGAAPAIGNTGNWINDYANAGPGSVSPSTIASKMSPYMNQYVMQALAPGLEAQDQQFAGQNKSFDSASTGSGAFGDSSYNLGRTNLTNQQNIGRTGLVADAYQRAFNTAIGAGAQDVSNDINAQTTNANLRETQLGREAAGAKEAFGMGVGSTNLTNSLGGQQTAQDQAKLNAQYNEFLRQQYQDPKFRQDAMNSAITAGRAGSDVTTTTTAPNNAGYGLLGSALGAVGTVAGGALGGPIGAMAGGALGGMIGGGGGGEAGANGVSMYGPGSEYGYADGGRPPVGRPVLVGERGPEAFIPDGGLGGALNPYGVQHFAAGGDYPVDQQFEVGETGPEEIVPDRGEPIIVGQNGPEVITMKEPGTVIPHEALTADAGPGLADGGLADQLGASPEPTAAAPADDVSAEPPLFLKSGTAAAPQPPQPAAPPPPARSPARSTAALGNPRGPSPAQQDLDTLADMRDNPGQTISKLGGVGIPIGAAVENAAPAETRRVGQPLNSPKPKPEKQGVAYPNSSNVFDLLGPSTATAAESHDPRPAQEIPEPTEKEGKEITRIGALITAKNAQIEKKIKASKYSNPAKDPDVMSLQGSLTTLQADLARVEGPGSPLGARRTAAIEAHKAELADWNARQADLITKKTTSELPYAQKYPERQSWIQENMPKVSAGTGLALGLLGKGKMVAPAVKSAVAGGFEGAGTAAWPSLQDTEFLPPGGNWKDAAGRIFNGDESSKDFWKRVGAGAMTHGGIAVGMSGAGSAVRDLGGQMVEGAKSIRWPKPQAAETPPNSVFAPPAGAPAAAAPKAASAMKAKGKPEPIDLPDGSKLTKFTYDDGRKPLYHRDKKRISEEEAQKLMAPPPRAPRARPPIQAVQ